MNKYLEVYRQESRITRKFLAKAYARGNRQTINYLLDTYRTILETLLSVMCYDKEVSMRKFIVVRRFFKNSVKRMQEAYNLPQIESEV